MYKLQKTEKKNRQNKTTAAVTKNGENWQIKDSIKTKKRNLFDYKDENNCLDLDETQLFFVDGTKNIKAQTNINISSCFDRLIDD